VFLPEGRPAVYSDVNVHPEPTDGRRLGYEAWGHPGRPACPVSQYTASPGLQRAVEKRCLRWGVLGWGLYSGRSGITRGRRLRHGWGGAGAEWLCGAPFRGLPPDVAAARCLEPESVLILQTVVEAVEAGISGFVK
jgi:hypothetical protein